MNRPNTPDESDLEFTRQIVPDEAGAPASTGELRSRANERLESEIGLPRPKDEAWRFVTLHPLTSTAFETPKGFDAEAVDIEPYAIQEAEGKRLVFVDGQYAESLSDVSELPDGVEAGSLAELEPGDEVADHLGCGSSLFEDDYFATANDAAHRNGSYLWVPPDTAVEGAVHLLHLSTGGEQPKVTHPRHLVGAGRGSRVAVVEEYVGPDEGTYFTNALSEVSVASNARVEHVKIQGESIDAFHVGRTGIDLDDWATYDSQTVSYGAQFSRFDTRANGDGEEIDCTLDGLAVLNGDQESDTHTVMDHRQPNAGSHQLHKMIIDDDAHAVFNGKIFVQPYAQKIDAYQLNRTLALSNRAKVNTKPQLEIFADDVSCTHGATIGQLQDDQKFYLRSRGLDERESRELLIYAFAAEILNTIPVASVHERLADTIADKTSLDD